MLGGLTHFGTESKKKGKSSSWATADRNGSRSVGVGHFACTVACRASPDRRNWEAGGERLMFGALCSK